MGFWNKYETEMHLAIAAADPLRVGVYTNWPYYLTRFERCQGFTLVSAHEPAEGGREINGELDVSEFNYLWVRKTFGGELAERNYWRERKALAKKPENTTSDYKAGPHERETVFVAVAAEPYWLTIETDAATWLRRLDAHPYAVCLQECVYGSTGEIAPALCRTYKLPRSLLTIRARRPQYSEEHLQSLRERLQSFHA